MKQVIKYLLKERGINWFIALKTQKLYYSQGLFSLYDDIAMALHYKRKKEDILYRLDWELRMTKDYAQYQPY